MTLLVTFQELIARREAAHGSLAELGASLVSELTPMLGAEPFLPPEKALLSRDGGRCPRHGVFLEFDPRSPHAHRCPIDGEIHRDEVHYRFWIYWYQMWLAERAVHGALLAALGFGDRYGQVARTILQRYADRYTSYPNSDNVLGPTRLFFSTYLESIWLLQIAIATDLLETTGESPLGGTVRDRIIEPSRAIISVYDEGLSNRQVWNNAALLAAARLLGDDAAAEVVAYGHSGIATHLGSGLLVDGSWYEGENYHLFAHRGLWYGVTIAERAGLDLPLSVVERFDEGFAVLFETALPDFTLPSRRDSQYAISLRQWRIAEHCELGFARTEDLRLWAALARLYDTDAPAGETGRSRSSADVERNMPPSRLSRADLSWRALLHALPHLTLPDRAVIPAPRSALLDGQGIAVFRRQEGRVYLGLDYGHHGGGHGHPDRLNLLLVDGDTRWLDDMGTGSYVDPSLHWYRSTLAHNAPLVNGRSQARVHGTLLAYDETDAAGWVMASAEEVAPGASLARTLVAMNDYCIDEVEWRADQRVRTDLPIHLDARIVSGAGEVHADHISGGTALADGFSFLREMTIQRADPEVTIELTAAPLRGTSDPLRIWWWSDRKTEWWRAVAPGAPGTGDHAFRLVRAVGNTGIHRSVWSWAGSVVAVEGSNPLVVTLADGTRHLHQRTVDGWEVTAERPGAPLEILLLGGVIAIDEPRDIVATVPADAALANTPTDLRPVPEPEMLGVGTVYEAVLGADSYRRSESSWDEAGEPTAAVSIEWDGRALIIDVDVEPSDLTFVFQDAINPYDNEPPDINGDGVQLYVATHLGLSGWLLVPESGVDTVRVRDIEDWTVELPIFAEWSPTEHGYRMHIELQVQPPDPAASTVGIDVIVNEKPADRERRRGQLVLSGGAGEFVYLRGDRHEPSRLVPFVLTNA